MGREAWQETGASTIRPTEGEYWRFRTLAGDAQLAELSARVAGEAARTKALAVKAFLESLAKKYHVRSTDQVNFDDEKGTITCVPDGPSAIASRATDASTLGQQTPAAGA
jgi:hypothetical protein